MTPSKNQTVENFSLVAGGPMFRLLCLLRASGPSLEYLPRRMLGSALIAWLPLLVLAALEGNAFGDDTELPCCATWETGLRFIVVLPLLFWADVASHRQLGKVMAQFRARQMIPPPNSSASMPRCDRPLACATRRWPNWCCSPLSSARRLRGLAKVHRSSRRDLVRAPPPQPGRDSPWQECGWSA